MEEKIRTVPLSNCSELDNFSAAFWGSVNATPENFSKTLTDGEYKTIALYFTKIAEKKELGISSTLKTKIVKYLRYHFRKGGVADLFSKEEELLAQNTLLRMHNLTCDNKDESRLMDFNFKIIKSNTHKVFVSGKNNYSSEWSRRAKSKFSFSSQHDLNEDDVELALQYFVILKESEKQQKVMFDSSERKQANVVMMNIIDLAVQEKEKEVEKLKRKLNELMSLE